MTRKTAYYTCVRVPDLSAPAASGGSLRRRKCGRCGHLNGVRSVICRGWNSSGSCGRRLIRRLREPKPRRGTEDRLRLDLAHASMMADLWTSKAKRAVTVMHEWNRKERRLAARLAAGPQPPKPKRASNPLRAIKLKGVKP